MISKMESVSILGVQVTSISLEEALKRIVEILHTHHQGTITHVHIMGLNIAYENEWFRDFLNQSDMVYCDGYGVLLGSQLLGKPLPQRFTLADWIDRFAEISEREGFSWYFLGNHPESAKGSAALFESRYPNLKILGTEHGYKSKERGNPENSQVINEINRLKPDILFVGFGMPIQEKWLNHFRGELDIKLAITCGGLFDVLMGRNPRGPHWKNNYFLEWAARLLKSPRRYAKRYLVGIPLFIYRVLLQRLTGVEYRPSP